MNTCIRFAGFLACLAAASVLQSGCRPAFGLPPLAQTPSIAPIESPTGQAPYPMPPTPTRTIVATATASRSPTSTPIAGSPTAAPRPTSPATIPPLERYVIGAPAVVFTSLLPVGIIGWVPDGESLLLARRSSTGLNEYVEAFDVQTRRLVRFGERTSGGPKPIWLPALGKVAFTTAHAGENGGLQDIWLTGSGPDLSRRAVIQRTAPWSFSATGDTLAFVPADQTDLVWADREGQLLPLRRLDLATVGMTRNDPTTAPGLALSPNGSNLAVFGYHAGLRIAAESGGIGNQIALGAGPYSGARWPFAVRWSPDGQRLAVLAATGAGALTSLELLVLELSAASARLVPLPSNFVTEFAWAPNSQHLLTWAITSSDGATSWANLYLADALTGATRVMLPEVRFGSSYRWTWNMDWSPTGTVVASNCPGTSGPSICILTVSWAP